MTDKEFADIAQTIAESYNTVYASGMFGSPINEYTLENKTNSKWYTDDIKQELRNLVGKDYFGFDCICLVKGILWGWNGERNAVDGGAIYKSNGIGDVDQDGFYLYHCYEKFSDFTEHEPHIGEYLLIEGKHAGIYIGDGFAVECTKIASSGINGVIISAVANMGNKTGYHHTTWTHHATIEIVDYSHENKPTLRMSQTEFYSGEQMEVIAFHIGRWKYLNSWMGLYQRDCTNYLDNSLGTWCYAVTGTHQRAKMKAFIDTKCSKISASSLDVYTNISYALPAGEYKIVIFRNEGYAETYYIPIRINSPILESANVSNRVIEIKCNGIKRRDAWIGIYPEEQNQYNPPYSPAIVWRRVDDFSNSIIRVVLPSGISANGLKTVLFADNSYNSFDEKTIQASYDLPDRSLVDIDITGTYRAQVVLNASSYYPGESIEIKVYGITEKYAWVGIYAVDDSYNPCATGMWAYTSTGRQFVSEKILHGAIVYLSANVLDVNTGTKRYLAPGKYKVVLFKNDGYIELAHADFTIKESSVFVNRWENDIEITYNGAPTQFSWVGIYESSVTAYGPEHSAVRWMRVHDDKNENVVVINEILDSSKSYKAVLFADEGYVPIAKCDII